jgi:hypothetical protein
MNRALAFAKTISPPGQSLSVASTQILRPSMEAIDEVQVTILLVGRGRNYVTFYCAVMTISNSRMPAALAA